MRVLCIFVLVLSACQPSAGMPDASAPPLMIADGAVFELPPCMVLEDLTNWVPSGVVVKAPVDACGKQSSMFLDAVAHAPTSFQIALRSPVRRQQLVAWYRRAPADCLGDDERLNLGIQTSAGLTDVTGDVSSAVMQLAAVADIPADGNATLQMVLTSGEKCRVQVLGVQFTEAAP